MRYVKNINQMALGQHKDYDGSSMQIKYGKDKLKEILFLRKNLARWFH